MSVPVKTWLAFIATLAVFYGFGAFVCWDWNPGNWLAFARFGFGSVGLLFASAAAFREHIA